MDKPVLVIMAAGMGSRYGGLKQIDPVDKDGHIIMDFSMFDARRAGFEKVIFIIKRENEADFRETVGKRIEKYMEVSYAFQEAENLPEGYQVPEGRVKPWGTAHAVLSCIDQIHGPFAVINADDYYGKEAFYKVHEYLVSEREPSGKMDLCMAGFILGNTLSEHGAVTRGICSVDAAGNLLGVDETRNIKKTAKGASAELPDGGERELDPQALVSMNMWGLTPEFMETLKSGFGEFLAQGGLGDLKAEYLLPDIVDGLVSSGKAQVSVLRTDDTWFGVTYQEDKYAVREAFKELIRQGAYPQKL